MDTNDCGDTHFNPYVDDPLLTAEEAAAYLKVKLTTLNTWRREKKLPCIRAFADARYRRSDLNKFINSHRSWGWMKESAQ
jgi:excisionase family DNA binding protein